MDRGQFDTLARLVSRQQSRRSAIATVLRAALPASVVAPILPGDGDAKRGRDARRTRNQDNSKAKRTAKRRHRARARRDEGRVHAESVCYPNTRCTGRFGAYLAKCDFGGTNTFEHGSCVGCDLRGANFTGADASDVKFSAVNLGGACLVDADFSGGTFFGVKTLGATFCRTRLPNGTINNGGCGKGTNCCPTCDAEHPCGAAQVCCDGNCRGGDCCAADQCPPSGNICDAFQCRCGDSAECSGATPNCCGDGLDADCHQCCDNGDCRDSETCCSRICVPTSSLCGGICGNICEAPSPHCCGQTCRTCCTDAQCTKPNEPSCLSFQCVSEKVATTFERVRTVVADILGVDEDTITMESEFMGDLNADSLDVVELIIGMEEEFGLTITDEDAEKIRTVGDAVQYIVEHGE